MKQTTIIFALLLLIAPKALFSQETFGPNTELTICFNATHTYVSDLGFYLIGPQECGSPIIPLSPNPQSVDSSVGCCCNSGNNADSLCFSTNSDSILNVCSSATPLTGTFGGYDSVSGPTLIDWSQLYGCPIESGSWRAQIFDCIGADTGSLTGAYLEIFGQPQNYIYPINSIYSSINDNSCTHQNASIVQFGTDSILPSAISDPEFDALRYQFDPISNTIMFSSVANRRFSLILCDLHGRVLLNQELPFDSPINLPKMRSMAIMSVFEESGRKVQSIKLVMP